MNFTSKVKIWGVLCALLALSGCAGNAPIKGVEIDRNKKSASEDARPMFLVMHYTALPLAQSLDVLTNPKKSVSAHYLVPDRGKTKQYKIFQLVPEERRAWHAGVSEWQGASMLNAASLGIEIVNPGFPETDQVLPPMQRHWQPYGEDQVRAIGKLAQYIVKKYAIKPTRVVGHSDIAPGRKNDPGPLFPWQRMHEEYQVGAWYDLDTMERYRVGQPWRGNVTDLQEKLARFGYAIKVTGQLDETTQHVMAAFQMHFRASRYDGVPDIESVAILEALLEKYQL